MVTEHEIRERAYHIWQIEGRHDGRAEAHWLQAETELTSARAAPLVVVAVEAVTAPSPAQALKPAAKKRAAKAAVPKAAPSKTDAPKTKRAARARSEGVALH